VDDATVGTPCTTRVGALSALRKDGSAPASTEPQPSGVHARRRGSVSFTRPKSIRVIDRQRQVVPMKVGVAKETAPGERRVALVP